MFRPLLLAAALSAAAHAAAEDLKPVPALDLDRYAGVWHEIARLPNRFEDQCVADITATYTPLDDGKIGVVNACREGSVDGPYKKAEARGKVVEGSNNAKLKLSFFGPFYVGDYWILDHADDYSWSIVGEPSGRNLWILSRDARPSQAVRDALYARARAMGYDLSLLRETRQCCT